MSSGDLALYQQLNGQLTALADEVANLVRAGGAAADADDAAAAAAPGGAPGGGGRADARARQAPGELLEVMTEKVLAAGAPPTCPAVWMAGWLAGWLGATAHSRSCFLSVCTAPARPRFSRRPLLNRIAAFLRVPPPAHPTHPCTLAPFMRHINNNSAPLRAHRRPAQARRDAVGPGVAHRLGARRARGARPPEPPLPGGARDDAAGERAVAERGGPRAGRRPGVVCW